MNNESSSLEPRLSRVLISVGGVPSLQHLISVIKEVRQEVIFNDCTITVALGVGQPNLSMKSAIETVLSLRGSRDLGEVSICKSINVYGSADIVGWQRCLGASLFGNSGNSLGNCR